MAFPIAKNTLDSLLKAFRKHDMAIFVFSTDDDAQIRNQLHKVVRDNVLFEAGVFVGMQGGDRTFIVSPRDIDFHMASDLLGITTAVYEPDDVRRDITSGLSGAVARIRKAIKASNWATQRLSVRKKPAQMGASTLSFSLKVVLTITNSQPTRVLVQANGFEFGKGITCHPRASSTQPPRWSG